ncbi:MAG: DUF115 domain-containing protein [Candidatus Omnitrophota bacterium]|jgi:hypothetical protein|nr:MAG: DUF115 domain-containing protein [Candidatus Omnitrophota bacterium]
MPFEKAFCFDVFSIEIQVVGNMVEQPEIMTGTSRFEANLAALAKLNQTQAETIAALAPKVEKRLYPVRPVADGFSDLTIPHPGSPGISLFTSSRPNEEIHAWLTETDLEQETIHAVIQLGFGLGYFSKAILQRLPEKGVLAIVEPDPIHFFTAFSRIDLTPLLLDKRVSLYVGQKAEKTVESIGGELEWGRFLSLPHRVLVTPLIRRLLPDYPSQFVTQWRDSLQRESMYRNARIEHSSTVVLHTTANADAVVRYPGISTLLGRFQHIPAALIAAGPSLEKSLDALKENQDRFIIACMNTAYPVLRRNGIRPHFVFAMDHQERNVRSFEKDNPSEETYLICDPRIDPRILQHFHPRVFLVSWRTTMETLGEPVPVEKIPVPKMSGNAVYLWLQSLAGEKGDVFGPGSVAVVGFHILSRLGCQPIILVGQDLAFTGDKRYADGTIFDDKSLPRDQTGVHQVSAVDGGVVETSDSLYLYRRLLEHEIARFKVPVYNTSFGALIMGTITSRLETLLPDIRPFKGRISDAIAALHETYVPQMDRIDMQRALESARKKLGAFSAEARTALELLPSDAISALSVEDKRELVGRLETVIANCAKNHREAFELLNELLQESHFKYEECRWRYLMQTDEDKIWDDKIHSQCMVLDEFVKQAEMLSTLFEEKILELDR